MEEDYQLDNLELDQKSDCRRVAHVKAQKDDQLNNTTPCTPVAQTPKPNVYLMNFLN